MSPEQVFRTIVSLVPNWYMAEYGPKKVQIQVGDSSFECHALINPPPSLRKFREKSEALAAKLMTCPSAIYPTFGDILREALALAWLQQATDKIDWAKLLDYAGPLADRTYENAPVTVNVIARPSETGLHDLADERFGKITDHLSSGLFTYFIVDGSLRVADYCEVGWDEITTSASYKLYPELPHPFQCVTSSDKTGVA